MYCPLTVAISSPFSTVAVPLFTLAETASV
jgi:hypothetical protein